MKKRYGVVFPNELFETQEEAVKYASDLLTEEEIGAGLYVFEAVSLQHYKSRRVVEASESLS